jgi:glycolate oxidase FAD binding subunit
VTALQVSQIRGMIDYNPAEFTFTAYAGTPLEEVNQLLAANGQYLPFDPPLAARGATLGGTVAAGLSGPGRYQFGGVRDFLIGVRYMDGEGQIVRGGGKVVKNAAGYDLPKLMVGSLGQFGILVELTFKVFPRPQATATAIKEFLAPGEALQVLTRLSTSPLDPNAIDIRLSGQKIELLVRMAGPESAMPRRLERLRKLAGDIEVTEGPEEDNLWSQVREMAWVPSGWLLVKIPTTPRRIPMLETMLAGMECLRHYSGGGQLLWLATPASPQALHELLAGNGFSGLAVFGPPGSPRLGLRVGTPFEQRVKTALDPNRRFAEV